jgi:UDP-N-acetylmuramate dehydrogenase
MKEPPLPPAAWLDAVPLSAHTTLGVGGPARHLARCRHAGDLRRALDWAEAGGLPVLVLGGGSNLLVSDEGFPGLVVQLLDESLSFDEAAESARDETVLVRAGAGLSWDHLVAATVERGLAGIECLSGIPGLIGAAPIQNIGAYGQEIGDTLAKVEVLDRTTGESLSLDKAGCTFGYRTSAFKTSLRDRYVVTAVSLRLFRHGRGAVRYRDLERLFSQAESEAPSVAAVREAVLEIRRSKSMVLGSRALADDDPNRRSAGSFFLNPLVSASAADDVANRVLLLRGPAAAGSMPRYPAGDGRLKLSAAWLIERAGFHRGYCLGAAGLSTRHVLALVNRGGATARDLLTLAGRVRRRVRDAFGITLQPEPVFLGFRETADELLG